ncbi:hypothetical protein NE237_021654 [Protea cynaroides]|uniref:Uncharacterized protein n=1 Tax=Protea cynaroides TaxID=273540 RepID=A0A9Q0K2T6_9MAGN|nr:hypothetical protein NE237_021654 [Protea cynaroides]
MLIQLLIPVIVFTNGSVVIIECFFSKPWPLLGTCLGVSWLYGRWKVPLEPLWWQLFFLVFLLLLDSSKFTRYDISVISSWLGLFMLVFRCLQEVLLKLIDYFAFCLGGSEPQQEISLDLPRILEVPVFFTGNGLMIMAATFLSERSIMWRLIGGILMSSVGEATFFLFSCNYCILHWVQLRLLAPQDRQNLDLESAEPLGLSACPKGEH